MNTEAYNYYIKNPPRAGSMRNAYELGRKGLKPNWLGPKDSWSYAAFQAGKDSNDATA